MTDHLIDIRRPATTPRYPRFLPLPEWTAAADRLRHAPGRHAPCIAVLRLIPTGRDTHHGLDWPPDFLSIINAELESTECATVSGHNVILLLRGQKERKTTARLQAITTRMAGMLGSAATPVCGWAPGSHRERDADATRMLRRAILAADHSARRLDLVPVRWAPELLGEDSKRPGSARTAWQIIATLVLGLVVPFGILVGLSMLGIEMITATYLVVVGTLVITSALMWAEALHALDPKRPPEPKNAYPPASAIIAAYLPNEADTIMETVRTVLAQNYPGRFQVILAYNTPHPLPVEAELRLLARQDSRLLVLEVANSTSKAQNVNAALGVAEGEFVGVFDADHQPAPGAFARAWAWLDNGADVVQGHCVVRNGDESWIQRTIAVEFEAIYAVSHPGRAALHGFGIFGGSNGFWRTSVLRGVRMQPDMLTEDIDSSIRLLLKGGRIVSDPALVSYELAPDSMRALWHQRMRWAQGWFQVSRKHLKTALRSPYLTVRQKLGTAFLLGWREVTPWVSLLIIPVIAALAWKVGGVTELDWLVPAFLLTSAYATTVGPMQVLFSWRLAVPLIRRRGGWFAWYAFVNLVFYSEWKNLVARVAHLKEFSGERRWVITPRTSGDRQ